MADTLKILGQAASLTDVYTVPGATQATVSTIYVCNRSAVAAAFRVSVAVAGAGDATKQYLYYDLPIPGNESFAATVGVSLGAGDVVRAYASTATLSVNVFGVEVI
jgi:hypothetical protein